jgi:hypothetical protein
MQSVKHLARQQQALQVIHLMTTGMTQVEACKHVGIPRSTFYLITSHEPEILHTAQEVHQAHLRDQYEELLVQRSALLLRLVEDGLNPKTKPRDRIAILKFLDLVLGELSENIKRHERSEPDLKSLFTGPTLLPGRSTRLLTSDCQSRDKQPW